MGGCGGNCACAKQACDETKEKLGMKDAGEKCPCGKPIAECCKTTGKTCGSAECHGCAGGDSHAHE